MSPRLVLAAAGLAAIVAGGLALRDAFAPDIAYEPLAAPEGFRRVVVEGAASPIGPLFGLTGGERVEPPAELCAALYGPALDAPVPVAFFTDVACPFCRTLEERLDELEAGSDGAVAVVRREWPILGATSVLAARALLAARAQGAGEALAERLQGSAFVPTPAYLEAVAAEMGLDARRLLADMDSAETDRALEEAAALAGLFGFVGTPGLVIGRTVVEGSVSASVLRRVAADERAAGPLPFCPA